MAWCCVITIFIFGSVRDNDPYGKLPMRKDCFLPEDSGLGDVQYQSGSALKGGGS
ncbi:hypothetical protein M430DRAFT_32370 [Amorphotheca resinae ATCC 22711]|uniref:Uncharacterized protein n=1 Tax=Amorphotheca resinae ATCC 22711 TaxID=857342 RepID=A0A2T3BEH1_AMORE|nr:hypothetical protein M430DRAFT_32370 [Amorphotheca resinae ATCC 22711]PSS27775.1 hypothetical protein M430DRAFT_32370 [Amorphotheca resinae ATCC 22711]